MLIIHRAILRITAELEKGLSSKARWSPHPSGAGPLTTASQIWFLAPTVALCEQQHRALTTALPTVHIRLLVGSDNVDCWSEQRIWDIVLDGFRIVVSTYAILADALSHGFITMQRLSLLVFDEGDYECRISDSSSRI